MTNKLTRSSDEKIFGVAAGLASHFNIDVTVMRLLWVLAVIFIAHEIAVIYLMMALILPKAGSHAAGNRTAAYSEPEVIIEKDPASII